MTKTTLTTTTVATLGTGLHRCAATAGLGVRVGAKARTWIVEARVGVRTVRKTLAPAAGPGSIGHVEARRLAAEYLDRVKSQGVTRRHEVLTLAEAVAVYVEKKRRRRDKKPLKLRTKVEYLRMIQPASGRRRAGALYALAGKRLTAITGDHIRAVHEAIAGRGERQQAYAMEVLRAVLKWHAIATPDSPLSQSTPGPRRIVLPPTAGNPSPLSKSQVTAWWKAASAVETLPSAALRIQLLTGMRPGEPAQCERIGDTLVLADPKNRRRHVIYLSKQAKALADAWPGPWPKQAHKTMTAINAAAGTPAVTRQNLRQTFATLAARHFTIGVVKRLLNQTPPGTRPGDVTLESYIGEDAEAAAAWQQIADMIEQPAAGAALAWPELTIPM